MQFGVFWTTGQICSATSRVLVHSSLLPAFKARLKQRSEAICIADPHTPESRMGPLVNRAQYDKVMAAIEVCSPPVSPHAPGDACGLHVVTLGHALLVLWECSRMFSIGVCQEH